MTIQRRAFLAGVAAAKEAIKNDMGENWEAWGQASTDERCWYVDGVEVPVPSFEEKP